MRDARSFDVRIMNLSGQLVHRQISAKTEKITLDVAGLSSGIYFAQFRTDEGVQTVKFIKE
jgi:hypothetical protein